MAVSMPTATEDKLNVPSGVLAAMPSAQGSGVLPSPAGRTASPGSTMSLDDGGSIPDPGDAMPGDPGDPGEMQDFDGALDSVQAALGFGRKQAGLPQVLMAGNGTFSQSQSQVNDTGPSSWTGPNQKPKQGVLSPTPKFNPRDFLPGGSKSSDASTPDDQSSVQGAANGGDIDNPADAPLPSPGGDAMSFDDGGSVDSGDGGDMSNPSAGGMPNQPVMPQRGQGDNPQGAAPGGAQSDPIKGYVFGANAVPPEVAQALEAKVDPQGQMDPSARKLMAVASAGDPSQQFGLLQHYRQKFNAYNGFAKAAAQGTGQKPADLAASANAANQAYENVPDGTSMAFKPVRGGVAVQVKQLASGSAKGSAKGKSQPGLDEGGVVPMPTPDPRGNPQDPGNEASPTEGQPVTGAVTQGQDQGVLGDPSGSFGTGPGEQAQVPSGGQPTPMDIDAGGIAGAPGAGPEQATPQEPYSFKPSYGATPLSMAGNAASKFIQGAGNTQPLKGIKNFVLSIPQYLQFLSKDGQYDNMMDQGGAQVLSKTAQSQLPGMGSASAFMKQGAPGPTAPTPAAAGASSQYNTPVNVPADYQPGEQRYRAPAPQQQPGSASGQSLSVLPDNPTTQQIDAFNASNGGAARQARTAAQKPALDPKLVSQANALFPSVSQQDQRNAYIAQQMDEQQKRAGAIAQAQAAWGGRANVANINQTNANARNANTVAGSLQRVNTQQGGANTRNANTVQGHMDVAAMNVMQREVASGNNQVAGLAKAIMTNIPGTDLATATQMVLKNMPALQQANTQMTPSQQAAPPGRASPAPSGGQQGQPEIRYNAQGQAFVRGPDGTPVPYSPQ